MPGEIFNWAIMLAILRGSATAFEDEEEVDAVSYDCLSNCGVEEY